MKKILLASFAVALSASMVAFGVPAHAQDQRTTEQGNTTVRVSTKAPTSELDKRVKQLAQMLGIKVKHTSKKVWLLTGQAKQIQSFQKMAGSMGLTLGAK